MNDRTRRPTMAPEDDPSIPVLTERLTFSVPAAGGTPANPTAASADAAVDRMVFPTAAPARSPERMAQQVTAPRPALPTFELPPAPAMPGALLTSPHAAEGDEFPIARAALPLSIAAAQAAPTFPIDPEPAPLPDATAIRNAVLDELAARLPREIEGLMRKQLAGSIEAAVQAASTDLAARIRNAAAQSLQHLVEQAVKAELARLRQPPPM